MEVHSQFMDSPAKCPVCKRTDHRVQIVYVPLGHGRFTEYVCVNCHVSFPWGRNKFGDITSTDQVKEVAKLNFDYESNEKIKVEDHPDFTPEVYCDKCKKLITHESRHSTNGKWFCTDNLECR